MNNKNEIQSDHEQAEAGRLAAELQEANARLAELQEDAAWAEEELRQAEIRRVSAKKVRWPALITGVLLAAVEASVVLYFAPTLHDALFWFAVVSVVPFSLYVHFKRFRARRS